MADSKISNLPAADALSGSELIPVVQDGETRRSDVGAVQSFITVASTSININVQTGASYTIDATDRSKIVSFSNGSAIAVTLPEAGGSFPAGWFFLAECTGVGTVTITPTTSTIDGASSLDLETDQGVIIASDGTNYYTMRGIGGAGGGGGASLTDTQTSSLSYNAINQFGGLG